MRKVLEDKVLDAYEAEAAKAPKPSADEGEKETPVEPEEPGEDKTADEGGQ